MHASFDVMTLRQSLQRRSDCGSLHTVMREHADETATKRAAHDCSPNLDVRSMRLMAAVTTADLFQAVASVRT